MVHPERSEGHNLDQIMEGKMEPIYKSLKVEINQEVIGCAGSLGSI